MLLVLSPSKTLDFDTVSPAVKPTQPSLLKESAQLVAELKQYDADALGALMKISPKLSALNVQRYQDYCTPFTEKNAKPSLLAFKGDVYEGIDVDHYEQSDFAFAQQHVRILSGLYGVLRPMDLIQPYRLEMGTRLTNERGKNLYEFWGDKITGHINVSLAEEKNNILINLASEEYFKAIHPQNLKGPLINIVFKEQQKNVLKVVGLFAKRARGLMTDFIIKNRIDQPAHLQDFTAGGYGFDPSLSDDQHFVFVR